jgi:hypothetical protein
LVGRQAKSMIEQIIGMLVSWVSINTHFNWYLVFTYISMINDYSLFTLTIIKHAKQLLAS